MKTALLVIVAIPLLLPFLFVLAILGAVFAWFYLIYVMVNEFAKGWGDES